MLEPSNKARDAVLIFSAGAIVDFVWALFRGGSAFEAILCAFLGLFGTALYVCWHRIFDDRLPNTKPPNQDSDRPPHWVP